MFLWANHAGADGVLPISNVAKVAQSTKRMREALDWKRTSVPLCRVI